VRIEIVGDALLDVSNSKVNLKFHDIGIEKLEFAYHSPSFYQGTIATAILVENGFLSISVAECYGCIIYG
jgi:hypothetical protein